MRRERAYFAVCAASIGWAIGYALPVYARLPNLYYDPQLARWIAGARPGSVPMGYYGQMLWGVGGAALAATIGLGVAWRRGPRADSAIGLAAAWTLSALLLVGAWFTWNNWP